jgi:hypothetical protein
VCIRGGAEELSPLIAGSKIKEGPEPLHTEKQYYVSEADYAASMIEEYEELEESS